jgi:hypothetical protein
MSEAKAVRALKNTVRGPLWWAYVQLFQHTPLIQRLIASPYLNVPPEKWPGRVARILDLNMPQSLDRFRSPTPACGANINNILALLERARNVEGDIAECGVFRGASLAVMGLWVTQQGIDKTIHGFDSFKGFSPTIAKDIEMGGLPLNAKRPGGMSETSYGLVYSKVSALRLHNIKLHAGFFDRTLSQVEGSTFSFIHLDCDTYDAYVECLGFFYPRLSSGGIILLDEYDDPAWPGCNKATDEFLRGKPEKLQPICEDNYLKYYFVKQ